MLSVAVLFTLFRLFAPYAGKTHPSQELNKYGIGPNFGVGLLHECGST